MHTNKYMCVLDFLKLVAPHIICRDEQIPPYFSIDVIYRDCYPAANSVWLLFRCLFVVVVQTPEGGVAQQTVRGMLYICSDIVLVRMVNPG